MALGAATVGGRCATRTSAIDRRRSMADGRRRLTPPADPGAGLAGSELHVTDDRWSDDDGAGLHIILSATHDATAAISAASASRAAAHGSWFGGRFVPPTDDESSVSSAISDSTTGEAVTTNGSGSVPEFSRRVVEESCEATETRGFRRAGGEAPGGSGRDPSARSDESLRREPASAPSEPSVSGVSGRRGGIVSCFRSFRPRRLP
mmetsp:Transcript_40875/g.126220  ORF Transcript_40875/g.126220 Transcript_40875/m.126220 type:complete len:206 (-) Transcript_40875:601-1218(-)